MWVRYRAALSICFVQIGRNRLSLVAAGVAFFAMLSVFPALAALIAVLSLIADPAVVLTELEAMRGVLPGDVYDILHQQIAQLVHTSSDHLGWAGVLSLLVALWSARAGVGAMMAGLNAVYGVEGRSSIGHYARAFLLTLALIAVGIIAVLTVIIAPIALGFLPLGLFVALLAELLRWSIAIAVTFAGIGLLYRFGPNHDGPRPHWITPGLVLAGLSWAVLSILFSFYVANFGNYNEVYGSIGAVIAMLIWLWISSFLVLAGATFNAALSPPKDAIEPRSHSIRDAGAYLEESSTN